MRKLPAKHIQSKIYWLSPDGEWAIVALADIPAGVHRSGSWSVSGTNPREISAAVANIIRVCRQTDGSFLLGYTMRHPAPPAIACVRTRDLPWVVWEPDGGFRAVPPVPEKTDRVPTKRVIPEYPGTCSACGARIYLGLNEIVHEPGAPATCRGTVR